MKRVLLVNSLELAATLALPSDTLVIFADPERLGDPLYCRDIVERCGEGISVFAPLDLMTCYKGDALSGLQGLLGVRLTSIPMTVADIEKDPAGLYVTLIAREHIQAADDVEFNRKLAEERKNNCESHSGEKLNPEEARAKYPELTAGKLAEILGLTIKRDEINKVVTFLCQLSAFTESSQLNISFNAPSSTGKSYIPMEVAGIFPKQDVITVSYCSPTGFFHDVGKFDTEKCGYVVDLSRKVLIFLDQPHTLLLQHLRPLLSHDQKELLLKITDKSQRHGLKTKNIFLRGYPSVIFCTAGLKIDEQESTRFLLLSPETSQEKIREAINQRIYKEASPDAYSAMLEGNTERQLLKERVLAIRNEQIGEIKISNPKKITERFFGRNKVLKPRHSRDMGRILALIKSFALLNLWHRQREGDTLVAGQTDIDQAFDLWEEISESQELNLPPYIYNLFKDVILIAHEEKGHGLTRSEIVKKHFQVHGRMIPDWQLRQEIIPMLETVGLITQEPDPADKRRLLVYPTTLLTTSREENNSESQGGVTGDDEADCSSEPIITFEEETGMLV